MPKKLVKGYGDRLLIDGLSFLLPPGGIVGVIGPNGAGKTTLFRMIVGEDKPDQGELEVGATVVLAYVDQSRDNLEAEATVFDEITGGVDRIVVGNRELHGRAYVASFGFKGSDQQKQVGQLSGGERNRVQLAKVLKAEGTFCFSTNPLTTWTLTRSGPSRIRSSNFRAVRWSSATTAGSSIGSPPTCWPSKGTRKSAGGRGISAITRSTGKSAWGWTPTSRIASDTSPWYGTDQHLATIIDAPVRRSEEFRVVKPHLCLGMNPTTLEKLQAGISQPTRQRLIFSPGKWANSVRVIDFSHRGWHNA